MKTLYAKNIRAVSDNLPLLQKKLSVGLSIDDNHVCVTGKEENIYDFEKVLEALEAGFSINESLLLSDPEYLLEVMSIRDYSRRTKIKDVRARLIGTKGKTKKLMEKLSDSFIKIKGNSVFIIGLAEDIRSTMTAVQKLIRGSAQGKVYGFLERSRTQHKFDKDVSSSNKPKFRNLKIKSFDKDKFDEDDDLSEGVMNIKNLDDEGLELED